MKLVYHSNTLAFCQPNTTKIFWGLVIIYLFNYILNYNYPVLHQYRILPPIIQLHSNLNIKGLRSKGYHIGSIIQRHVPVLLLCSNLPHVESWKVYRLGVNAPCNGPCNKTTRGRLAINGYSVSNSPFRTNKRLLSIPTS